MDVRSHRFRSALAVVAAGLVIGGTGGCAPRRVVAGPPAPIHLFVAPVEIVAPIRRLRYLESSVPPLSKDEERRRIRVALQDIQMRIRGELVARLADSRYVVVPDASTADAVLQLRVVAYGRVPGTWVALLFGSGIVEAVVQGVVVERVTHREWLALAVGGEELLSEGLTWLGGAFVTNRYLTPMIFTARLVDARSHRRLWHHDVESVYSRGIVAKLPKEKRRDRAAQLAATENDILGKLVKALNHSSDRIASRLST